MHIPTSPTRALVQIASVPIRPTAAALATALALTLILALALLPAPATQARELRAANPAREGVSPARLERITRHIDARVEQGVIVGGQGMLSRNGRLIYSQTYGNADREAKRAMADDAIFRIYSMTKPVTGVALMMLYEEGHFSLNDPVAKYIPELADLKVALSTVDTASTSVLLGETEAGDSDANLGKTREPARQPTIRDLLTHTAGFSYGLFGNTEVDRLYREAGVLSAATSLEFVTLLGQQPLQYEPGSRWHYSVSVDVQGRLVEVISGMSLGAFMRQRIFDPLDMPDTSFRLPAGKRDRLAQIYSPQGAEMAYDSIWKFGDPQVLEVGDPEITRPYLEGGMFESGGGGLLSTARDYMRFGVMLLNGGELDGVRLLSPKSVQLMTRNHIGDYEVNLRGPGVGFGLGFAVTTDIGQVGELGSDGEFTWGGAAGTLFWVDPQENLVGVFMMQNIPNQTNVRNEFHKLAYQAIVESYVE